MGCKARIDSLQQLERELGYRLSRLRGENTLLSTEFALGNGQFTESRE
jgi:hypothetical protein